ncbi:hypothetical protein JTB14_025663 [Gonioctena quinquepunctata]|nr:hypothetical protein JTB14_025663 [Gonioctena quinquepunctata]
MCDHFIPLLKDVFPDSGIAQGEIDHSGNTVPSLLHRPVASLLKPLTKTKRYGIVAVLIKSAAQKAFISKDYKSTETSIQSWLKRSSERMSAASNKN